MRQENQTFKQRSTLVYITPGRVITCAVRTSPPRSRSPKSLEHKHHNKELRSPSLVATNSKDQEVENNLQCEKHAWKSALGSKASMGSNHQVSTSRCIKSTQRERPRILQKLRDCKQTQSPCGAPASPTWAPSPTPTGARQPVQHPRTPTNTTSKSHATQWLGTQIFQPPDWNLFYPLNHWNFSLQPGCQTDSQLGC